MSDFDRFLKYDLTEAQIRDWDIPGSAQAVFDRFSNSYGKFKGDEEFFLKVFSKAASDWVKKKSIGAKPDSLSKHFSTYLKKDMKKRDRVETEPVPADIEFAAEIPEACSDFGLDSEISDTGTHPSPVTVLTVEALAKVVHRSPQPEVAYDSRLTINDSLQPEVAHDLPQPEFAVHPSPFTDHIKEAETASLPALSILDEEEPSGDDPSGLSEVAESEGFEKHKKKRAGLMTGFIVMFILLIGTGIAMTVLSKMFEVEKPIEEKPIEDYSEMKKGQIQGSLTKAMNEKDNTELIEQKVSQEESRETAQNPSHTPEKNRNISSGGGNGGGNYGSNAKKDEEILNQYASEVDPASGGGVASGNPRGGRRYFTPGGGGTLGGVFIKGSENSSSGKKSLDMHNIKVKVRLEFSIRSTAASTVIAVVTEDSDRIPKGAKFYGSATGYVNKKTQLSFSKLLMNGEEYTVKGFGISGKDPGIESEVTDIAKDNIDSSIKQGVVQTLAGVANKYAGGAGDIAGDAASNTVDPAALEIQKQADANKMTQEYRVPAGTAFFIYLE